MAHLRSFPKVSVSFEHRLLPGEFPAEGGIIPPCLYCVWPPLDFALYGLRPKGRRQGGKPLEPQSGHLSKRQSSGFPVRGRVELLMQLSIFHLFRKKFAPLELRRRVFVVPVLFLLIDPGIKTPFIKVKFFCVS